MAAEGAMTQLEVVDLLCTSCQNETFYLGIQEELGHFYCKCANCGRVSQVPGPGDQPAGMVNT